MAAVIRIDDNRGGYQQLVDYVLQRGRKQPSRNGDTLEVTDMVIELAYPDRSIPSGIGRKGYSYGLAALEGLQLVAGETYDDLMVKVAPNTERFREDDGMFHGGYGRRISEQMEPILERLKKDPATRQAVVTLWSPALDLEDGKRDYPCTCLFNWRIRNDQLLMSTFMRSQDIHWGWPYDVVMFTTLQLAMADFLGVEAGPYTHHAASFHAYTKDIPALQQLHYFNGEDVRLPAFETTDCDTWSDVMGNAARVASALDWNISEARLPKLEPGQRWYYDMIARRLERA